MTRGTDYDENYYDTTNIGNRLYRITGAFPDTLNYDDNGNVVYDSASGAYYTYDRLNHLVKISVPNGSGGSDSIRYVYGRNGQRVEKRFYWFDGEADSAITRYHLSGDKVLMETYPTGGTPRKPIYAGDDRIALFVGGTSGVAKYYYVKDHLGSTRLLVKSDGNVYAKYYRIR